MLAEPNNVKKSASIIGKSRPVLGAGRNPVTGGGLILARFFFLDFSFRRTLINDSVERRDKATG